MRQTSANVCPLLAVPLMDGLKSLDDLGGTVERIDAAADVIFEPLLMVPEVAAWLHMHPKTLQAMARAGTVPATRMGKHWMFRASSLDAWFRDKLESEHQSRRVQ